MTRTNAHGHWFIIVTIFKALCYNDLVCYTIMISVPYLIGILVFPNDVHVYMFCPNQEPCPVLEPGNVAAQFRNQLPGSRTSYPVQELDKHIISI